MKKFTKVFANRIVSLFFLLHKTLFHRNYQYQYPNQLFHLLVLLFLFFSLQAFISFFFGLLSKATRTREREKNLGAIPTRREQLSMNSAAPAFITICKALCSTPTKHVNFYFPRNFHFYLSQHYSSSDVVMAIVFCFSMHVYIMCVVRFGNFDLNKLIECHCI